MMQEQKKDTFHQQVLFYIKVLAIFCLTILVLLTGHLLVHLSLLIAGNSGVLAQPQAIDISGILIASDYRHAIVYTLGVIIFLIFSFLQTFGT